MPRANRYFVPGQVYHLTHRCHNRQFLLKFARDRNDYRMKLRQGVAEFELSLLDYSVTSNHVHLIISAENPEEISRFMQRVDGEFAQSYNRRKRRSGAYWEDRFHSTMIEPAGHLEGCLVYIALNMVRCRAVAHPREWPWCGYQELMGLRQRFRMLDLDRLLALLRGVPIEDFRRNYEAMIRERIAKDELKRESKWTEAIAVGSETFVRDVATRIRGRQQVEIEGTGDTWALHESGSCADFLGDQNRVQEIKLFVLWSPQEGVGLITGWGGLHRIKSCLNSIPQPRAGAVWGLVQDFAVDQSHASHASHEVAADPGRGRAIETQPK